MLGVISFTAPYEGLCRMPLGDIEIEWKEQRLHGEILTLGFLVM